jgi:hypothetical protein
MEGTIGAAKGPLRIAAHPAEAVEEWRFHQASPGPAVRLVVVNKLDAVTGLAGTVEEEQVPVCIG